MNEKTKMKSGKKVFLSILAVFLVLGAAYSALAYFAAENNLISSNDFYFYLAVDEGSNASLSKEEIMDYESKYKDYSSDKYYSLLNEEEKVIYKAVVYAFENNEVCIFIPADFIPTGELSVKDIMFFVALDSPLVEQNIAWGDQSFTAEITVKDRLGLIHSKEVEGNSFYIQNFSEEKINGKLQAVKKAEEIISDMPADITEDKDKITYFFDFLAEGSDYIEYENMEAPNFVYDALISRKSNCDGFANALSLLCNMSDIECFEKMCSGKDEKDGHTWNCVILNDQYYNVDVTNAVDKDDKDHTEIYLYFPDVYNPFTCEYENMVPPCTDASLSSFDCAFTSESNSDIAGRLVSAFKKNSNKYVCAYFENVTEQEIDKICDLFSYKTEKDFTYITEDPETDEIHTLIIVAE